MEILGDLWKVGGMPLAALALLAWVLSQVFKTQRMLTRTLHRDENGDPPASADDSSTNIPPPPPRRVSKGGSKRDRAAD